MDITKSSRSRGVIPMQSIRKEMIPLVNMNTSKIDITAAMKTMKPTVRATATTKSPCVADDSIRPSE